MNNIKLKVQKREKLTQGYLNQLRKQNLIPAICYGKEKNINLSVDKREFEKVFKQTGEHILIDLDISNNKIRKVLVKAYQISPIQKEITHIDFFEVTDDKLLQTKIPIRLTGTAQGIKVGGILEHILPKLNIKTLPKFIPQKIEIDVTHLDVGDSIYVNTIELDKNIKILASSKQTIAAVVASRTTKLEDEQQDQKQDEPQQEKEEKEITKKAEKQIKK